MMQEKQNEQDDFGKLIHQIFCILNGEDTSLGIFVLGAMMTKLIASKSKNRHEAVLILRDIIRTIQHSLSNIFEDITNDE
jgi:hypothetical protein